MNAWWGIAQICYTVALLSLWISMRAAEKRLARLENGIKK